MNTRTYLLASATVFGIVALVHVLRLCNGWPAQLGPVSIPLAASWLGVAVPGALSACGFLLLRR
jgi:hypothetical protein